MAAGTRILLSTVGPFIDYGERVVEACIESGTDYVDSTGEAAFVALLLQRHAKRASERGIRLVPNSGFDAVIADLGAYYTVQRLPSDQPIHVSGFVMVKTHTSGGTERSAIKSLAQDLSAAGTAFATTVSGRKVREERAMLRRVPELDLWAAPLPTIDASVVVRSAASIDLYGPDFRYTHHAAHSSVLAVILSSVFFGIIMMLARVPAFNALFLKFAKKPGDGPTDDQIAAGWFSVRFLGESDDGRVVRTRIDGGDPFYGETSKILSESALCLALDGDALPRAAGLLTPAAAMGDALLARLVRAGIRFSDRWPPEAPEVDGRP
jgi:short subunit dehydrogenase-like uncharacterized protein